MKRLLSFFQTISLLAAGWCLLDAVALINRPLAYAIGFLMVFVALTEIKKGMP